MASYDDEDEPELLPAEGQEYEEAIDVNSIKELDDTAVIPQTWVMPRKRKGKGKGEVVRSDLPRRRANASAAMPDIGPAMGAQEAARPKSAQ